MAREPRAERILALRDKLDTEARLEFDDVLIEFAAYAFERGMIQMGLSFREHAVGALNRRQRYMPSTFSSAPTVLRAGSSRPGWSHPRHCAGESPSVWRPPMTQVCAGSGSVPIRRSGDISHAGMHRGGGCCPSGRHPKRGSPIEARRCKWLNLNGAPGVTRTRDPLIRS